MNKTFEDSVITELKEETSLVLGINDLTFIIQMHTSFYDPATNMTNNALRRVYALRYDGVLSGLRVEAGESDGFEAWRIEDLFHMPVDKAKEFNPLLLEEPFFSMYRRILALL